MPHAAAARARGHCDPATPPSRIPLKVPHGGLPHRPGSTCTAATTFDLAPAVTAARTPAPAALNAHRDHLALRRHRRRLHPATGARRYAPRGARCWPPARRPLRPPRPSAARRTCFCDGALSPAANSVDRLFFEIRAAGSGRRRTRARPNAPPADMRRALPAEPPSPPIRCLVVLSAIHLTQVPGTPAVTNFAPPCGRRSRPTFGELVAHPSILSWLLSAKPPSADSGLPQAEHPAASSTTLTDP